MTRRRIPRATMAGSLFALDTALLAITWPLAIWLVHLNVSDLSHLSMKARGSIYPLCDLLFLYSMGLYRREAFVEKHRSALRVPVVVGMGAIVALFLCMVTSRIVPSLVEPCSSRAESMIFLQALSVFTVCAFAARVVIDVLFRRRLFRRQLLVVGAGSRAWDLSRMLAKEGASLSYDIAYLQDPAFGAVDPRLESEPNGTICTPTRRTCWRQRGRSAPSKSLSRRMSGAAWTSRNCSRAKRLAFRWSSISALSSMSFAVSISSGWTSVGWCFPMVLFRRDRPLPETYVRSCHQLWSCWC